jgi:TetR/AcrR family transcriptional regulator
MHQDPVPAKEALILAAARKRFAHYGFSKVTMDEIAADVGMAKPSLYYYYDTKERLFSAVVGLEQEHFAADIDALLKRRIAATQKLKEYVGIRMKLFRELVNLSHLGFDSWTEMKSMTRDLLRNIEHQELRYLQTIIAEGRSSGEFSLSHPNQTAQIFLHVLQGLRLRMLRPPLPPLLDDSAYADLKKESEMAVDILVNGIRTHSQRHDHA